MAPKQLIFCVVALVMLSVVCSSVIHSRRSVAESMSGTEKNAPKKVCYDSSPCAWLVYTPIDRKTQYFMQNTCICSEGKTCIQTEDDISVGAYVYRCRSQSQMSREEQSQVS